MTDNQFDGFFKKKLHDHESTVPVDMWQKIEQKKDKRRRFIFWWALAAMLLTGGITGSYFLLNSPNNSTIAKAGNENNPAGKNTVSTNKKTLIDSSNYTLDSSSKNSINEKSVRQNQSRQDEQAQTSNREISGKNIGYNQKDGAKNIKYKDVIDTEIQASAKAAKFKKSEKKTQANELVLNKQTLAKDKEEKQSIQQDKITESTENKANETVANQADTSAGISNLKVDSSATVVNQNDSLKPVNAAIKTVKKTKEPKDRYIEVYASPDYAFKQSSSTAAYSSYLKGKNSAEKSTLSFSIGIRYTQMLSKNFFIKTGLQYSQVNESFRYKSIGEYRNISVPVARTVLTGSGSSYISGNSMFRQVGYRIVENANRYSSVDVPLLFGYETNGSSSFKMSITSGVLFNLTSSYKGYMVDTFYKAVNINDLNAYQKNLGISLYFSLGLMKQVSDKISLFGEPYLRYRLKSMTQPAQPFNQKLHTVGLSLGLRYNF